MDNTTPKTRLQVAQKLRRLTDVAAELEEAGVRIITAEATTTRQDNILVSAHERDSIDIFRAWLGKRGLDYAMDYRPNDKPDPSLDLAWEFSAVYNTVLVHGFLTGEEKGEWDKEDKA